MRLAICVGIVASVVTIARGILQPGPSPHTSLDSRHLDTPVEIPLNVFQIEVPVRDSYDGAVCSQTIVQNDFTASYGKPYLGTLHLTKTSSYSFA